MSAIFDNYIDLTPLAEAFREAYAAADLVAEHDPERARAERYGIDLAVLAIIPRIAESERSYFRSISGYRPT